MAISAEPRGLTQPQLLISLIIMNQSVSDPSNLPGPLWRRVARCERDNRRRRWQLSISAAVDPLRRCRSPVGLHEGGWGDSLQPRIQKWEISPLKWNMKLWFDWKGATVWVTPVNTHLPRGVLSLKLLPGSVLPGAAGRSRWLKSSARYSDKVLADSLLIGGFSRRQVAVWNGRSAERP